MCDVTTSQHQPVFSGAGHNGPSKEFLWDMDFLCQAGKELTFEGLMVGGLEMPSSGGVDSFVVYVFCLLITINLYSWFSAAQQNFSLHVTGRDHSGGITGF